MTTISPKWQLIPDKPTVDRGKSNRVSKLLLNVRDFLKQRIKLESRRQIPKGVGRNFRPSRNIRRQSLTRFNCSLHRIEGQAFDFESDQGLFDFSTQRH